MDITVTDGPRPAASPEHSLVASERRQITVVCCGLVEVLDLSGAWSSPGLEILSEAMPELRSLAQEVATRFEGHLGTTLGHLLWIYFGYPSAHGDDGQRALRAARELVARVGRSAWARGRASRLALRAGVHSGPAVVSKDPRQSGHLALGPTLDLATGLQSLAPAHGVLASDLTGRPAPGELPANVRTAREDGHLPSPPALPGEGRKTTRLSSSPSPGGRGGGGRGSQGVRGLLL